MPRRYEIGSSALKRPSLLLLVLVALAPSTALAADPPVKVENIRVGLDNVAQVGAWTPVWVDLSSTVPFEGTLAVSTPDDDGAPVIFRQPIQVQPGQVLSTTSYVRPGSLGAEFVVRVYDSDDRPATRPVRPDDLRGSRPPDLLFSAQALIVALGKPAGLEQVPQFAQVGETKPGQDDDDIQIVRPKLPNGLPARWYGLDAAAVIIVDGGDPEVRAALPARAPVLREWVKNGGHLIVATASHGQELAESLGDLLPVRTLGTTPLNDLGALETFAGSTSNPINARVMNVARIEVLPSLTTAILAGSSETPLVVRAPYGFGRATWIGVDVDQKPFSDWKDRHLFWARALELRTRATESADTLPGAAAPGAYFQTGFVDLATTLHTILDQPPGVTIVPFGWVALLVFLYILLIGPLDYLFLKHVVKRMELTWLTFPAIVLGTTLLAYLAAYALKGRELKILKIDAVDVDAARGISRGQSWVTLFSPANRDYSLAVVPLPLLDKAPADPLEITAKAPLGTERLLSWFAPPTTRFGGNNGSGLGLMARPYNYTPPSRVEALEGVRVPIWSTKSFDARWSGPSPEPLVESDLVPLGADRLDGSLTNLSSRPLVRAVLIYSGQVYDQLGTIAPGATVRINSGSRTRPLSGYLEERARGYLDNNQALKQAKNSQTLDRASDLVRTMMFRDSMSRNTATPPSRAARDLDLSGQVNLDRPMLVADLEGPACALQLEGASGPASVNQATILRVLLPLSDSTP